MCTSVEGAHGYILGESKKETACPKYESHSMVGMGLGGTAGWLIFAVAAFKMVARGRFKGDITVSPRDIYQLLLLVAVNIKLTALKTNCIFCL